jgi:MFS family permease
VAPRRSGAALPVIGLDHTILNLAPPSVQDEFDASASTLQWMVDSYLLVFAGLLLAMGTLGDRFGRKGALLLGLTVFWGSTVSRAPVGSDDVGPAASRLGPRLGPKSLAGPPSGCPFGPQTPVISR